MSSTTDATRARVLDVLDGGIAFMPFEAAIRDFPPAHYNTRPSNVAYSFWHILEHIRRTARDILDYVRDPDYRGITWPDDYWPAPEEEADAAAWNETLRQIREDMAALRAIVADPANDLDVPVLNAGSRTDHTLLREALLVAQHNAYHIGEFAVLRQVTGTWPPDHEG
jgi:hypothetical protein